MIAVFWWMFPRLKKLLSKDDDTDIQQTLKEIKSQLEAERREKERIQAEIQRKDKLSQEEARKLQEALRKSKVQKQRPAMSDKDFVNLCEFGNARKVEEAIMNGANVNARDSYTWNRNDSRTALMQAACTGQTETAEVLLKHGAYVYVNARSNHWKTALMLTVEKATQKQQTSYALTAQNNSFLNSSHFLIV